MENYPVRIEMNGTKQIPSSHGCSIDESELKELLVNEYLLQTYYTHEDESKGIIVDKCSTEEDESECICKNINKQKDADYE